MSDLIQAITIQTHGGPKTVECSLIVKGLAVHPVVNFLSWWTITHIKTGMNLGSAGGYFTAQQQAEAAAREIAEVADWRLGGAALSKLNLKPKVAPIAAKHDGRTVPA